MRNRRTDVGEYALEAQRRDDVTHVLGGLLPRDTKDVRDQASDVWNRLIMGWSTQE